MFLSALSDAAKSEGTVECIVHLKKLKYDGMDVWLKLEMREIGARDCAQKMFFTAVDDVSKSIAMENSLKSAVELQSITLSEMNITVFEYDIEKDFLSYQIFKKDSEPLRATVANYSKNAGTRHALHPDDRHLFFELLERIKQGESVDHTKCRMDLDGSGYKEKIVRFTCLKNSKGKNVRIVARID